MWQHFLPPMLVLWSWLIIIISTLSLEKGMHMITIKRMPPAYSLHNIFQSYFSLLSCPYKKNICFEVSFPAVSELQLPILLIDTSQKGLECQFYTIQSLVTLLRIWMIASSSCFIQLIICYMYWLLLCVLLLVSAKIFATQISPPPANKGSKRRC